MIAAQEVTYRACLAVGPRTDCTLQFDIGMIATPRLLGALAVSGRDCADPGDREAGSRAHRALAARRLMAAQEHSWPIR